MGAIIIIIHYIAFWIGFILTDKIYNFIKDKKDKKQNERLMLLYKNEKNSTIYEGFHVLINKPKIMVDDLNDILLK